MRRLTALEQRLDRVETEQASHHRENTGRLATIEANQGRIAESVDKRFNTIDSLLNQIAGGLLVAKWISRVMWPLVLAALGWLAHKLFIVTPAP